MVIKNNKLDLIVLIGITLCIFLYLSSMVRWSDFLILYQRMPELKCKNEKMKDVLQKIANNSKKKRSFHLCQHLPDKIVSISIKKGSTLKEILEEICKYPDCKLQLWQAFDNESVVWPILSCSEIESHNYDQYIIIRANDKQENLE